MGIMDKFAVFLLLFYAALRVHGTGLDTAEPETVFLGAIATAVWALAFAAPLCRERRLLLPPGRLLAALGAFAGLAGLAVFTASRGGCLQPAADLGWTWLADGMVFLAAVSLLARLRLAGALTAALLAGLALTAAFGIYQRLYGMDYLRAVLAADGAATVERLGEAFRVRLAADRIAGQFAYANALAGFVVMILPLAAPFLCRWRELSRARRAFWGGLLYTALLTLVYSGSKAGFLTAKVAELFALIQIARTARAEASLPPLNWGAAWGRALAFAGLLATATALTLPPAKAVSAAGGGIAGGAFFALAWTGEIFLFGRWARLPELPPWHRRAGLFACGLFCAFAAAGGWFLFNDAAAARALTQMRADGKTAAAERLESARAAIRKQLGVRGNYWASAVAMVSDRPLAGFGLDNFGIYYSQYKRPDGWEVRRTHNLYLQLAVDGGLGLLAAFLAVWAVFFRLPRRRPGAELPPPGAESRLGVYAGLAAFAFTYALFYGGVFTGLGVEFFFNEWFRRGGTGASTGALLIHGVVNWLLLPGVWLGVFVLARRALEKTPTEKTTPWLRLGLAAALLHFFFDFHYYQAVNSAFFWLLAATALAARAEIWEIRLADKKADLAATGVILAAAALFGFVWQPRFCANAARTAAEKMALAPTPEELPQLQRLTEETLRGRPGDAAALRRLAETKMRLGEYNGAVKAARAAVAADPQAAGARVFLAQALSASRFTTPERLREIQELYRQAVRLYPRKPSYRLLYAHFLQQSGMTDADGAPADWARQALALSAATSDAAAKLDKRETARAEQIAAIQEKTAGGDREKRR